MANINRQIAQELGVREEQIAATVELLDGGATVPFVARYRKEITGGLDDAQLRTLEERLTYLRELEERRVAVLNSIREQGKLDAALEAQIMAADSKGRLEDIYLPFKPKRRTKAEIAKEAGLEPLSELLLTQAQTLSNRFNAVSTQLSQQNEVINSQLDTLAGQVNKLTVSDSGKLEFLEELAVGARVTLDDETLKKKFKSANWSA